VKRFLLSLSIVVPALTLALPAVAQQDPQGALFVGYSYLRLGLESTDSGDAHGAAAEYTFYLARRAGFVISASVNWAELDAPPNIFGVSRFDARQVTLMAGPHFVLWRGLTSEAGLDLLAGATKRRLDTSAGSIRVSDRWKFSAGANANLDVRITDTLWWRVLQPGIVFYRFGQDYQGDFRIATGLVIRGGEILQ